MNIESRFDLLPLGDLETEELRRHADDILDNVSTFEEQTMESRPDGALLWSPQRAVTPLEGEERDCVCENAKPLVRLIRGGLHTLLGRCGRLQIGIASEFHEKGEIHPLGRGTARWHWDMDRFVFVALGDVANVECAEGDLWIPDLERGSEEQEEALARLANEAVKTGALVPHSIPNGVPVLINDQTLHRQGLPFATGPRLILRASLVG